MIPSFDLFKEEPTGYVRWLGAFTNVEAGKEKARQLMIYEPEKYFIFTQTTGKLYVEPPAEL